MNQWLEKLERRVFATLTFPEVRRALQALNRDYVERRRRLDEKAALRGAGKRAAFVLYYGPLHFLIVREVVRRLAPASLAVREICDLGCGSGAAGVAWGSLAAPSPRLSGWDDQAWAVQEAHWTYGQFGLAGGAGQKEIDRVLLPGEGSGILAAYAVNELGAAERARLLSRLLASAQQGARLLVVEPLARGVAPWWDGWAKAFLAAGGRADEWRFSLPLPPLLQKFDRAAGLDHRELTCRTLWR